MNIVWRFLWMKVKLFLRRHAKTRTTKILGIIGLLYLFFLSYYIYTGVHKGAQLGLDVFGERLTLWAASLALGLLLLMSVISDLFITQTHDVAQRGSDVEWLQSLPLEFETFMVMKSLERLTMDITGVMFLLPALLGMAVGFSGGPLAVILAVFAFVFIEVLFGMVITLVNFALARFFPASTVRNMVQITNVLFLIVTFAVLYPAMQYGGRKLAVYGEAAGILVPDWITGNMTLKTLFSCFPPYWIVRGFHAMRGDWVTGIGWLTGFFCFCAAVWLLCLKAGRVFQTLGWTYQAEEKPGRAGPVDIRVGTGLMSGIVRKDLVLLKQDKGFMVNGLVVPLAFFLFYGSMLMRRRGLPSPAEAYSFLTMAIMYFHFFGAINSIGFEKKAVWVLRTLPLSAREVLGTKARMWALLAAVIYLPMFFVVAYLGCFSMRHTLAGFAWLSFVCFTVAHLGVAVSALYPNFEARFLQGGSTGGGKMFMAALSLPLGGIILFGNYSIAVGAAAVVALMTWALFLKAENRLRYLDENEELPTPPAVLGDSFVYLYFFFILNALVAMVLKLTIFKTADAVAITPVALLITALLMGLFIIRYFRKHGRAGDISLPMKPAHAGIDLALGLGLALVMLGAVYPYMEYVKWMAPALQEWKWTIYLAAVACAPVWEEVFFRGFLHASLLRVLPSPLVAACISSLVFALVHPPLAMPVAFVLGLVNGWLYYKRRSLFPCIALHMAYNLGVVLISRWM